MAPDRADLLTAQGLPDRLTALDRIVVKEEAPVTGHHLLRDRRGTGLNVEPHAAQDRE
jgi:hypothetical protein